MNWTQPSGAVDQPLRGTTPRLVKGKRKPKEQNSLRDKQRNVCAINGLSQNGEVNHQLYTECKRIEECRRP